MKYPINDAGVELLKTSEDFIGVAYPDPVSPLGRALQKAGLWRQTLRGVPIPERVRIVRGKELSGSPWTIGYGFTSGVHEGDVLSPSAGNGRLARELVEYVQAVKEACTRPLNENQLAALVVCAWNIGKDAIATSSMVKAHNRGDFAAAARAFALWNKAGGQVVDALVRRRAAEAALYARPVPGQADALMDDEAGPDAAPQSMPQTVQPETSLLRSPIVQGTAATATTGVTALAQLADQASTVKSAWGVLGPLVPYLPYIAIAAVVIVAGVVIYHRWEQRRGGWA